MVTYDGCVVCGVVRLPSFTCNCSQKKPILKILNAKEPGSLLDTDNK